MLLHQLAYDDATELKKQDAVEQEKLVLKADLLDLEMGQEIFSPLRNLTRLSSREVS